MQSQPGTSAWSLKTYQVYRTKSPFGLLSCTRFTGQVWSLKTYQVYWTSPFGLLRHAKSTGQVCLVSKDVPGQRGKSVWFLRMRQVNETDRGGDVHIDVPGQHDKSVWSVIDRRANRTGLLI